VPQISTQPAGAPVAYVEPELRIGPQSSVLRIVSRSPVSAPLDATLRDLSLTMEGEGIGVLVVTGPLGAAGIVSERDIVNALAAGADPDQERARDVMTADLVTLSVADTVLDVADLMLTNEIRHVLVLAGRSTVGVVSIREVLMVMIDAARAAVGS
jgi:CBS domain-containing protein